MPTTAVFFTRSRILRTDHWRTTDLPTRNTHVTTDTGTDIFWTTFVNLVRQVWISDGWTCSTDNVQLARTDNFSHFLRISETTHTQYWVFGHFCHKTLPWQLMALLGESRRTCVFAPFSDITNVNIPQIKVRISILNESNTVFFNFNTIWTVDSIYCKTSCNRTLITNRFFHFIQSFNPEACTVFERTTVAISTFIVIRRQELQRQIRVRAVDIDDIKASIT